MESIYHTRGRLRKLRGRREIAAGELKGEGIRFAAVVRLRAVMPALVHLVVTSVKCYGRLKGRDGRMRKDTRQEANYNNLSGL